MCCLKAIRCTDQVVVGVFFAAKVHHRNEGDNASSYLDTENWSSNRGYGSDGGFGFMIPRALDK